MLLQTMSLSRYVNINISRNSLLAVASLPSYTFSRNTKLKPKLKEFVNCDYVDSMDYGIYALTTGYIKETAMEVSRVAIVRNTQSRNVLMVPSESPFTSKPIGTRMGGGKGKVSYWAAKAVAGQWLFEFDAPSDFEAQQAFKHVKAALPVRVSLRIKPKEPKVILTTEQFLDLYDRSAAREKRMWANTAHMRGELLDP